MTRKFAFMIAGIVMAALVLFQDASWAKTYVTRFCNGNQCLAFDVPEDMVVLGEEGKNHLLTVYFLDNRTGQSGCVILRNDVRNKNMLKNKLVEECSGMNVTEVAERDGKVFVFADVPGTNTEMMHVAAHIDGGIYLEEIFSYDKRGNYPRRLNDTFDSMHFKTVR